MVISSFSPPHEVSVMGESCEESASKATDSMSIIFRDFKKCFGNIKVTIF